MVVARLDRYPPVNGRVVIDCGLRTAVDLVVLTLARCPGVTSCGILTAAGLTWTALGVTGCGFCPLSVSVGAFGRLRSVERRRRTRREQQEGVETVAVSQAPVVSGSSASVSSLFVRHAVAAFPPTVQDLAKSFLSLAGSASLGAVAGLAGTTVPASGEWVLLCPSASGVAAVTGSAARMTGPPSSATAVPGSSGRLRCELEVSCSSRRRRHSSGGGFDRPRWCDMESTLLSCPLF